MSEELMTCNINTGMLRNIIRDELKSIGISREGVSMNQLKSVVREVVLDALSTPRYSKRTMSKRQALLLFAERGKTSQHLEKLIDEGRIRAERASSKRNSRVNLMCEDVCRELGIEYINPKQKKS
jgi:hypothetical protein